MGIGERVRRTAVVAATLLAASALGTGTASASCAQDAGPDGAPIIFVGTPEAERRGYTQFAVEEVWEGPDLAPEVWVLSGQEQPPWPLSMLQAVGSSTDAEFLEGQRYVVGADQSFATGACSVTEADEGTTHAGAREPVDDGLTGADPPAGPLEIAAWCAAAIALLVGAVALLRSRRRRPAAADAD